MWIVFISNLRAGNGLTAGLFVYCTGAMMDCREVKMNLKFKKIREFLDQLTHCRISYGQKASIGIRVVYLQLKPRSPPQHNYKT
jgi:hypothetical protein